MVSLLYFSGMDDVSISSRQVHAWVSFTANYHAHIIEDADQKSTGLLSKSGAFV